MATIVPIDNSDSQRGFRDLDAWLRRQDRVMAEEDRDVMSAPNINTRRSLKVDEVMNTSDELFSVNKKFKLVLQQDQNFVLYTDYRRPIWAADTWNKKVTRAKLLGNGNLVLVNSRDEVVWESKTAGKGNGSSLLTVDNDGKAVIRSDGKIIWEAAIEMQGWQPKA